MGCGKTVMAILALLHCRLILIVCPIAVAGSWRKELGQWDPEREIVEIISGGNAARAAAVKEAVKSGKRVAVVVNYDSMWRNGLGKAIAAAAWGGIVLDESHRIMSPAGKASRFAAKLSESNPAAKRICLSGTPTPKDPLNWFGQFRFLCPEVLGQSFPAFRGRIAMTHPQYPGWVTGFRPAALQEMRKRIDPHVFRVKTDEVLTLPEAIHTEIKVRLSPKSLRFYRQIEEEMIAKLGDKDVVADNRLVAVTKLQQATSGHAKTDEGEIVDVDGVPAKIASLEDWIQELREPLVIFTRFSDDIRRIKLMLGKLGRTFSVVSGQEKSLAEWQAGHTEVLIVQQQAGGCGIDCTRAAVCVYYSLSHSLGDFDQSLARLRRPGQKKTVRYYHLIAEDTVDEDIYAGLVEKREVVDSEMDRLTRRTA